MVLIIKQLGINAKLKFGLWIIDVRHRMGALLKKQYFQSLLIFRPF